MQNTENELEKKNRAHYSLERKALIRAVYQICISPEDRARVLRVFNIKNRTQLYNLASRIGGTRPHTQSNNSAVGNDGYDSSRDYTRLYLRDDPETLLWQEDDDRVMRSHFGRTKIEDIALFLDRAETSVAYRARELKLRNIPKYYDVKKVAPWLGITVSSLFEMKEKIGLELFPCCDSRGRVQITLVSTTSLARCLLLGGLWKRLVDRYDADEIFIRDIIESMISLQNDRAAWEPNPWVSHGHTSLNPYSSACFGKFFNGGDNKMNGIDLDPRALSPEANVTSDHWRRNGHGTDRVEAEVVQLESSLNRFASDESIEIGSRKRP